MSERILKALMQLFAIIAGSRSSSRSGRKIVESFLNQQLNEELVEEYLKLFDGFFALYQKKHNEQSKRAKNLSLSSVKVLKICTHINEELDIRQKVVVLVRLLEFIKSDEEIPEQELEFVLTVADIFHFKQDEYELLKQFAINKMENMQFSARMLIIDGNKTIDKPHVRHLCQETLEGEILVLHFPASDMYLCRYFGKNFVSRTYR